MHHILLFVAMAGGPRVTPAIAQKVNDARKACAAGRVDEGIELLAEIIAQNGDPNALYNQGRCYQQNGRTEQAINRFREYLRTAPRLSTAEALRVRGYIGELEADLEARARRDSLGKITPEPIKTAAAAPPPTTTIITPPSAEPTPSPAPAPVVAPAPAPVVAQTEPASVTPPPMAATPSPPPAAPDEPPPPAAEHGSWMRPTSVILAGAGVVALGAAAYFTVQTSHVQRDLERPGHITSGQYTSLKDEGQRDETLARIGYGVGGAALVGSLVFYLISRHAANEGRLSLGPLVWPGGGGGRLQVRF